MSYRSIILKLSIFLFKFSHFKLICKIYQIEFVLQVQNLIVMQKIRSGSFVVYFSTILVSILQSWNVSLIKDQVLKVVRLAVYGPRLIFKSLPRELEGLYS